MADMRTEPAANELLRIELVYALPERQEVVRLRLPAGSTVQQAIEQSGLLAMYPEIDLTQNKLGIYAKLVKPDTTLRDRDRVEIYRPLIADPKEVRRKHAAEDKALKKAGGDKA
jgi:putative ubiquitin-RnfH superfamily antitoxin RatB of RatAB toxin-antitoxin module